MSPTDAEIELLPCPFCGTATRLNRGVGRTTAFECEAGSTCKGSGLMTVCLTEKEPSAITAWNRRPSPAAEDADKFREQAEHNRSLLNERDTSNV